MSIESESHQSRVSFSVLANFLTIGLINLADDKVERKLSAGSQQISNQIALKIPNLPGMLCPVVEVAPTGGISIYV
jgi:hypothetical protein